MWGHVFGDEEFMPIVDNGNTTAIANDRTDFAPEGNSEGIPNDDRNVLGGGIKRSLDVVFSLMGIVFLSPLFLLITALLKLTSPGPVLFGHSRVGFDGTSFRCWKFRSMVTDGDAVLQRHFEKHPNERREWVANRKLKNDPRVTWIGKVLRAYSVDELPQLLNVLIGNMSIVGPRPVVKDELENYGSSANIYLSTRPGLTGLWQTSGRSNTCYDRRVSLDTEYVKTWSVWQDFKIIFKTIPTVIAAEGSY
ncbi:MAG: sugar transferase [Paracoccaceae bacterium]